MCYCHVAFKLSKKTLNLLLVNWNLFRSRVLIRPWYQLVWNKFMQPFTVCFIDKLQPPCGLKASGFLLYQAAQFAFSRKNQNSTLSFNVHLLPSSGIGFSTKQGYLASPITLQAFYGWPLLHVGALTAGGCRSSSLVTSALMTASIHVIWKSRSSPPSIDKSIHAFKEEAALIINRISSPLISVALDNLVTSFNSG